MYFCFLSTKLTLFYSFLSFRPQRRGPYGSRPELVCVQGVVREPVLGGHGAILHARVDRVLAAESGDGVHEEGREETQGGGAQSPGNDNTVFG